ncbi:Protein JBTS17 [Nibea albiflora]|uniref:Protein JBTS17 n=1 Tax=Nibea albiflora TaxID=240163 RepID=A0ACB7F937_NIBAL|nr:Protein JBTS17 [Nibea albiflora]
MELKLEVVLSSSIKRKKPWPRFCWLGKEKESVFLLDDKRISEINMVSGRTKKRTPKLHPLLNSVVTMASSHSGMWLCGLLVSGELFLWNRDKDLLKTAAAVPEVVHLITATQGMHSTGNAARLSLQVSGDGMRVLLVAVTGQVFLWECKDVRDLTGLRDGTVRGQWAHITPLEESILPTKQDKEASQHTVFIKTEVMGDACLSAFVFTSGKKLIITCLKIQWEECHVKVGSVGYSIKWATKTYPMSRLTPPCQPVKSRGALVPAFSPDGRLLAIVLNQRQPKATQVLFVSTQNFVSISSGLGGCGSKKMEIPSKYISPPVSSGKVEASLSSSSLSIRDILRQRYSVTWHPRLLYLIVSDGYMATVMRVLDRLSPALLLKTLLKDTSKDLEKASRILDKSQIHLREWLESVSCLNLDSSLDVFNPIVTRGPKNTDSVLSAATDGSMLPLFLQDQGTLGGTKELLEKVQTFFEDDSDVDGAPAGSHLEDGGRLEFASMFDTLHALDTQADTGLVTSPNYETDFVETQRKSPLLNRELGKIQSEHLFLCGSYPKSADTWRSQICEESNKSCDRSVFKETQLCLALLYSLLSQYRLREAQELGDHMAYLILHRAGHQKNHTTGITAPSVGRLVPLCQEEVSRAVRRQQLSEVWTVDYAQDLLLIGGLLPETVWLAYHLGDWKTAASLSLAYTNYCTVQFDFTGLRRRELHLPTVLEPESIFQVELECLLGNNSQECGGKDGDKSFTDPLEEEDWDVLQVSIQEILKASVMAGVNVMSSPLSSLLDKAKDLCSRLPTLVPSGLYLPSPPLYCPQPSPNTQDPVGTIGQFAEAASRHKVSGVLQRLLLLLRSARCCHPAAQWYISHLRRARHLLHKVADTLVRAFPEEEESVRVPLREKYNSLLQRLRQCNVLEGEDEDEPMMVVIQDKRRQRRKHLGRLRRHLAPPELHLWEKEEEEEERGSKHGMAVLRQLSLGTSLSTSTLTDCGFPPVCSDGDTAENTSEAVSPERPSRATTRGKKAKKVREHAKKTAVKIESVIQEESHTGDVKESEQPSLPVVGTWEFELEDEEYLNFLELFLSYVLEKDSTGGGDSGSELPLLKSFSSKLRERELHSLTFDVLTTIHRRQRDAHHPARKHQGNDPPVFRAGSCYKPVKRGVTPELQTSSVWSEAPVSRTGLSVTSLPGLRTGRQKGLFGLRQQSSVPLGQRMKDGLVGPETSPIRSAFPTGQPSESFIFDSSTSVEAAIELQQGLDPKLEAQFPELGRLLEWMVRWADRRVLLGHHGKKKKDKGRETGGTSDGVVIRVKASAPAVLTSLSLLQRRYSAVLGSDRYSAHIQVPETQWTVAPVLQPEVDRKLERESSVDTGYPGSANTPITGLDPNLQQGELSIGSHTDEPEELIFVRTPLPYDQDQLIFDAQQRQSSSQQPSLDDLDVTPEKEGKCSDSEGLEESSSVSNGNISGHTDTPETSLKLADLNLSENAEDLSSSISLHSPPHPEPQALPAVQPEVDVHVERPAEAARAPLLDTPVDPPSLQPQSSTAGAPTADPTAPSQPLSTQTPPMRQRLGEDLFRLVQTQAPVPGLGSNNPQFSKVPACVFTDQPARQNSERGPQTGDQHRMRNLTSTANGADVHYQEMQPLSVQAMSPEIQFREGSRLIPHSLGLLATTDTGHSAPVLPPANSMQNDPAPQVLGLKLLHLHRPPLPQQIAPHYPPAQLLYAANAANAEHHQHRLKINDQAVQRKTEEEKGSVPKRQLSFNSLRDSNQPRIQTSERSRGQESTLLPPPLPPHTPAPIQGLRLLHFQPVQQSHTTFPKIPAFPSSRAATVIAAPMGEAPMIKLLHIDTGPKMANVTSSSSLSPNDPSHLHGGVGQFSNWETDGWRDSTAVAQSRPTG